MDVVECSTLIDYLKQVPDPRAARGRRHQWWVILAIVGAAHLAGQRGFRGIAQWAADHQRTLAACLPLWHQQVPSRCTFHRLLRHWGIEYAVG